MDRAGGRSGQLLIQNALRERGEVVAGRSRKMKRRVARDQLRHAAVAPRNRFDGFGKRVLHRGRTLHAIGDVLQFRRVTADAGQPDDERAARAGPVTPGLDGAAVERDELLDERETDAEPFLRALGWLV